MLNTQTSKAATTDRTILERLGHGDSDAYDDLVGQYGRWVFTVVRKFVKPQSSDFDDAMQEAMLAVWKSAPLYNPARGSEMAYITAVVRYRMITRCRQAVNRLADVSLSVVLEPGVEDADVPAGGSHLDDALDRLPPMARKIVELAVIEGMTRAEIAAATGLDATVIKHTFDHTILRLRRDLTSRMAA